MVERFGPPQPHEEDLDSDEDKEKEQTLPDEKEPNPFSLLMEFLAGDDTTEKDSSEDEKTNKKQNQTLSKRLLSFVGLEKSDDKAEPNKAEKGTEMADTRTEQPKSAPETEAPQTELTPEETLSEPSKSETEITEAPVEPTEKPEPKIEMPTIEEYQQTVETPAEIEEEEPLADIEQPQAEEPKEHEGAGAALAAMVAAEIIDTNQNEDTREKLQEQVNKQQQKLEANRNISMQKEQQLKNTVNEEAETSELHEKRAQESIADQEIPAEVIEDASEDTLQETGTKNQPETASDPNTITERVASSPEQTAETQPDEVAPEINSYHEIHQEVSHERRSDANQKNQFDNKIQYDSQIQNNAPGLYAGLPKLPSKNHKVGKISAFKPKASHPQSRQQYKQAVTTGVIIGLMLITIILLIILLS